MRQYIRYMITLAALLIVSMGTWADGEKVVLGSVKNIAGTSDETNASISVANAADAASFAALTTTETAAPTALTDSKVYVKVWPSAGYFMSAATVTARAYTSGTAAQSRRKAPGNTSDLSYLKLPLTPVVGYKGIWSFTLPAGYSVEISANVTVGEVTLATTTFTYNGDARIPGVKIGGTDATETTDYTITYTANTNTTTEGLLNKNAGTVSTSISPAATGSYWGSDITTLTYEITKPLITEVVLKNDGKLFTYDGTTDFFPTMNHILSVKAGSIELASAEYEIDTDNSSSATKESNEDSDEPYKLFIKPAANSNYAIAENVSDRPYAKWYILKNKLGLTNVNIHLFDPTNSERELSNEQTLTYTGTAQSPTVRLNVKGEGGVDGDLVTQDGNYSVSYASNTNAGSGTVIITGIGNNYKGEITQQFTIAPKEVKVKAADNTITYGDAFSGAGVMYNGFVTADLTEETTGYVEVSKVKDGVVSGTPAYTAVDYVQYYDIASKIVSSEIYAQYDITVDPSTLQQANPNYTFVADNENKGKLTVNPKEVGLDWSNTSFTFDGTSHVPTATATGLINGDVIGVTVTGGQAATGTGLTATANGLTGTKAACYKLPAENTTSFSITAADLTGITATAYNAVYDGSAHGITLTGVPSEGATVTYSETENGTYNTDAIDKTDVGTYTVYYKVTKTGYNEVKGSSTITITKAPIASVAVTGVTAPSTGAALVNTGAACATTGVTSISNVVWKIGANTAMGTAKPNTAYTAEVVLTADGNHEFTSGDVGTTGTIGGNSATATIDNEGNLHLSYTYAATDKVDPTAGIFEIIYPTDLLYDGTAKIATAVLSESYESAGVGSPTVVYYASTTPTTALSDAPVNAGTYILKVNVAEGTNYNGASGLANDSWTFTIEPCDYTVEGMGAATATFGTATNAVTGISGLTVKDVNSNTVSGSWAFTDTEVLSDVGNIEKTATFTPTTANANYKALTYPVTITVTAHNYTISGTVNATAVYGTATNAITISGLTVKDGDAEVAGSWAFASTDTDILEVGNTIAKTATFTPTDDVNYETLTHPITPVITPKSVTVSGITVTAKEYDGTTTATLDVSGATITGKVGEDDVTVASATGTYADANVGTGKQVTLTAITLGGTKMGNYTVDVANSTQPTGNITAKDITASIVVTVTNITTGGTPTVTVKVGTTTLVAGTDYTVTYKKGTDAVTTFNTAGTYTAVITAKDGSNYTFTQKEQNFTVSNPAPSVYYYSIDVTQPEHGTVSMNNNETDGAAGFTYYVTATADEGYYVESITVNGTAIEGNSFTMPYESVTVSAIIKARTNITDAIVTLDWTEKTYNGKTQKAAVSSVAVGETALAESDYTVTYAQEAWKNAGEYTITVAAAEGKNTIMGSKTVTFTIAKAALTVTADDKTMTQGDELPALTVSYSGFVNGETENNLTTKPTASTTATKTSEAGTYDITVDGGAADNYSFSYLKGKLTIKAKTPKTGDEVPVQDSGSGTQVSGKVTGSETDSQTGKTTYELTLTELPASVLNGTTSLADDDMQVEYQGNTYQVKKVEAGAFEGQTSGVIIFLPDGVSTTAPVTNVVNGDGSSTELNLNNVTSFVAPKTVHADKVTYQRSTAAGFFTLCLPYDFELPEGHTAWTLNKGVDGVAEFQAGGREVKAGEPYVVGVDDADKARKVTRAGASIDLSAENVTIAATTTDQSVMRDDVEMFGTVAGLSLTKGAELKALVIQPDFSWKMAPLTSELYVPAFECYLVVKGDMASSIGEGGSIPSSFGDATGIWGIETDGLDDGDWYNLDGSKLEGKPKAKGLYIHNGRKVVIK